MVNPVWHSFYEIGIDFIDDDHKNLMLIVSELLESGENTSPIKRSRLLTKFISATREHFNREEVFLHKCSFPGVEQHKNFHNELLQKADSTKTFCENMTDEKSKDECINKMVRLIVEEIFSGDITFKSYLEDLGYIKS